MAEAERGLYPKRVGLAPLLSMAISRVEITIGDRAHKKRDDKNNVLRTCWHENGDKS